MAFGRRKLLQWYGAALLSGVSFPSAAVKPTFREYPFGLGVASGFPSANRVVLWTRLLGVPDVVSSDGIFVRWFVWELGKKGSIAAQGVEVAQKELGYSVHVEAAGLRPNCWYEYQFVVGGEVSAVGVTRTLAAAGSSPERLRVAYASCQSWEDGFYSAYKSMRTDYPDLVLFLGDYIYEYGSSFAPHVVRKHGLKHIKSLQDFRDRYALYRSDPLLQEMHAACPWLLTWDDHEVENNYAGELSTVGHGDQFSSLRAAAYQAFYENMPLPRSVLRNGINGLLNGHEVRLFSAFDFGSLARIHMLDSRQYRDAPPCGASPRAALAKVCSQYAYSARSMLGWNQEAWLAESMRTSKSQWNIFAQQTVFTPADMHIPLAQRRDTDSWAGFPQARQRLIDDISKHAPNGPLVLGGDIHLNWVAHVHRDPVDVSTPVVASEFCGTSITSRSGRSEARTLEAVNGNPHCVYSNAAYRGYGLVDITPKSATVTLRAVRDVKDENSEIFDLKRFEVEAGSPQIKVTL